MLLKKFWRETQRAFQELAHAEQQQPLTANEMTLQQIFITESHLFFKGFDEKPRIILFVSSPFAPALNSMEVWRQDAELVEQAFAQQFQAHKRQIRTRFFLLG